MSAEDLQQCNLAHHLADKIYTIFSISELLWNVAYIFCILYFNSKSAS
jgi:hypothetical protein